MARSHGEMDPVRIIEVMQQLTTPSKDAVERNLQKVDQDLDAVLKTNFISAQKILQNDPVHQRTRHLTSSGSDENSDFRWKFVKLNLDLLSLLKTSLKEAQEQYQNTLQGPDSVSLKEIKPRAAPPIAPDTFSPVQQKTICTSLQFIVCLGLCPYLQPGVGIPVEMRSGFSHLLTQSDSSAVSAKDRLTRLCLVVRTLLECTSQPSIGSIILSRHLADVLAGLLQICHRPRKSRQTPEQEVIDAAKKSPSATVAENPESVPSADDSLYFKDQLQTLLNHIYQPTLVRELLLLQGGPGPVPSAQAGKPPVLMKAPPWLRKTCGRILSERLMQPQGVQHVLRGILDIGAQNVQTQESPDWRKCDAAARIIATCPMNFSAETYIKSLAPQIIDIVNFTDKLVAKQFLRVAVGTITMMMSVHNELAERYIMKPMFSPLYACLEDNYIEPIGDEPVVIVGEAALNCCISDLNKIFVSGSEPQSQLLNFLQPFGHFIFTLHCYLSGTASHLKSPIREILSSYLKYLDTEKCLTNLNLFAFGDAEGSGLTRFHPWLSFANGSEGGVVVMNTGGREFDWDISGKEIVSLLVNLNRDDLSAQFFISELKRLTSMLNAEISGDSSSKPQHNSPNFLEPDNPEEKELAKLVKNLTTLSLVSEMCDRLGHACFKNKMHILDFVQVTLERGVAVLESTDDEVLSMVESETLSMAMGLLTAVLSEPKKISKKEREKSKDLLPLLQCIMDNHTSDEVKSMASDLRIAIATHGLVQMEETKQKAETLKASLAQSKQKVPKTVRPNQEGKTVKHETSQPRRPLIEVLESTDLPEDQTGNDSLHPSKEKHAASQTGETVNGDQTKEEMSNIVEENVTNRLPSDAKDSKLAFKQAMEELLDPLVPVRGHALITLKRLMEQKDPALIGKEELLLDIFKENLRHEDSYLYLNAIQGLVALGNRDPERVLPGLLEVYSGGSGSGEKDTITAENKIKVGEILMKTSRNLGEVLPKYGDMLLNGILHVAKHTDHLVRASALSNLGEVCKLLHFSLGKVIHEVVACVSIVLKSDPEPQARKAAAMVITLILQGLGKDSIQVLGSSMRDLYHLLKYASIQEKDETVHVHVALSLQEMDMIMKDFLFPKQTLSKKLNILDPPENFSI